MNQLPVEDTYKYKLEDVKILLKKAAAKATEQDRKRLDDVAASLNIDDIKKVFFLRLFWHVVNQFGRIVGPF